jgi:hypothetical protein
MQRSTAGETAATVCITSGLPAMGVISLSLPKRELVPPATMIMARPGIGRGYFEPVIDLSDLIAGADTRSHVAFDIHGRPLEIDDVPDEPALLLSRPVTDAVKQVDDDRVIGSVDRSSLIEIQGFALGLAVLNELGPIRADAQELIEAVRSAGFEWVLLVAGHR